VAFYAVEGGVAPRVPPQAACLRIDAETLRRCFGEQYVRCGLDVVLEEPVRQDDVRTRYTRSSAHDLPHEASVVDNQLQAESQHAPAGAAGAARVRRDLASARAEGGEGPIERLDHTPLLTGGGVRAEGEDRVALQLLNLEGRRQCRHHIGQEHAGHLGAVLELGCGHERGETRNVRQNDESRFGPVGTRHGIFPPPAMTPEPVRSETSYNRSEDRPTAG